MKRALRGSADRGGLALGRLMLWAAQYLLNDAHVDSQKEHLRTGGGVFVAARFANDALDQLADRSALLRPEENRREPLLSRRSLGGQR